MENTGLKESSNTDKEYNDNYLVAFLDILGFKSMIDAHIREEDTSMLDNIDYALKRAKSVTDERMQQAYDSNYDFGMVLKQFSDCLSISFKDPQKFSKVNKNEINAQLFFAMESIRDIQIEMLKSKVYIRGGLSLGRYHKENNERIFSEGLINSYILESKKAMYPRIILHDNVLNILKYMFENHEEDMTLIGVKKILIRDWDGVIFINPFNLSDVYEEFLKDKDTISRLKAHGILADDVLKDYKKEDRNFQSKVLKNVEDKIKELKSKDKTDYNILKKYLWLKEFIRWNQGYQSKLKFNFIEYNDVK